MKVERFKMETYGSDIESLEDAVTGNLSSFCVLPPTYVGPPKRGHLVFNSDFECGNLGRVDYISEFEYDLFIRPDTCNLRFRVWFNFTVQNVRPDQRVIFNIVNFSKTKSLYRDGMSPVVKSSSRPKWTRIPHKNVYYYRCPEHRRNYVMSFVFCFDVERDIYQFAYCYPYTYTRLQNYLDGIEVKGYEFFHRELLTSTLQQRRLDLLTITNPVNRDKRNKQKVVFITARVHPGETPSSLVIQGVIDFLVSNHPMAKLLRDNIVFKIVPMLNPDGVYHGNYRCSLMGYDLNRHWHDPSPWSHPTLFATKNLLMEMDLSDKIDLDFYVDIHAHSTLMNGFMYGNIYEDSDRYERQAVFPKLFWQNAEDFSLTNTSFNKDAVKAGTGRRTLGGILDERCHCYTLEVSFYSYTTNVGGTTVTQPYTEEAYMRLGQNLMKTFFDYYKLRGYITVDASIGLDCKTKESRRDYKFTSSSRTASEPAREEIRTSRDSHRTSVAAAYNDNNQMPADTADLTRSQSDNDFRNGYRRK